MNKLLSDYNKLYPPKDSLNLINDSLIIFNTDILLNLLYIRNYLSKEDFFNLLYKLKEKDQLILTNQIAEDFLKNRLKDIDSINNTYNEIIKLFNQLVFRELNQQSINNIYIEGEFRYKNEIPPGYKCNNKYNKNKYRDLIIWNELIAISKCYNKNILFISDELKEDWIEEIHGKKYTRKELISEFSEKTQHFFYIFSFAEFIDAICKREPFYSNQIVDEMIKINEKNKYTSNSKNNYKIYKNMLKYTNDNDIDLQKYLNLYLIKINSTTEEIEYNFNDISIENEKNDVINCLSKKFSIKNLKLDTTSEYPQNILYLLDRDIQIIQQVKQFLYIRTNRTSRLKPLIDVLNENLKCREDLYNSLSCS